MSFWIVKNYSLKRPPPVLDISRILDSDSKHQKKLFNLIMSTRNVPLPVTSLSEEKSLRESLSQQKCKEPLSWEEIISITCPNTTDMRKDTEIFQFTVLPLSQSKKEISWWSDNADLFARPFTSMFWKWSPTMS